LGRLKRNLQKRGPTKRERRRIISRRRRRGHHSSSTGERKLFPRYGSESQTGGGGRGRYKGETGYSFASEKGKLTTILGKEKGGKGKGFQQEESVPTHMGREDLMAGFPMPTQEDKFSVCTKKDSETFESGKGRTLEGASKPVEGREEKDVLICRLFEGGEGRGWRSLCRRTFVAATVAPLQVDALRVLPIRKKEKGKTGGEMPLRLIWGSGEKCMLYSRRRKIQCIVGKGGGVPREGGSRRT